MHQLLQPQNPPMRIPVLFSWLFLMPIGLLSMISFCISAVSGQCLANQQSLLLQFKSSLVFDTASSTKLVHWNRSVADCCSWEGVTCNKGHVIGLDLTNESISSELDNSSSLFSLQYLRHLNLAYNNFSYEIPSQFDKLTSLSYLNLSNAGFTGQIPLAISQLTRLVILDLSLDHYYYYPPLQLENPNLNMLVQNLSELMELHLDHVNISANGYEWGTALSSSLPKLRVLSLSDCLLSGPLDSSLTTLQSLSIIRLDHNNFFGPVPESFADFKILTSLDFSNSWLDGNFPEKIFQIPTLQMLDLSNNFDLQGSLPEFPSNGSIRMLLLQLTRFSGTLPCSIGNLKMLTVIDLLDCNFNGSIPKSMASLTQLLYLDMSYNNFVGSIPSFSMGKKLTTIKFYYNDLTGQITSTRWEELLNLEVLDLSYNSLEGSIPISLFSLPSLSELRLHNNQFSGPLNELSNVSSCLLKTLYLSQNKLEGPIPKSLFSLPSLLELRLHNNQFSGPLNEFPNVSSYLLETLDLSHNNLEGPIPMSLFFLSSLSELGLHNNQFSSPPNDFPNVSSCLLKTLDLSQNNLEGPIPMSLFFLPSLLDLTLSNNRFSDRLNEFPNVSSCLLKILDLSHNNLEGPIPMSLFFLPSLIKLTLSNNRFSGRLNEFATVSSSLLETLILSHNNLEGPIPMYVFEFRSLKSLSLSGNNFNGSLQLNVIPTMTNLLFLDLSNNSLVMEYNETSSSLSAFPQITTLSLASNKLKTFPHFLINISTLKDLDLSDNQIHGEIPNWIWKLPNLYSLDLSDNSLKTLDFPLLNMSSVRSLDLRSNQLQGQLSVFPEYAAYLDFSKNNFSSVIPASIGDSLTHAYYFSLSSNKFYGSIPGSMCNAIKLGVLDLSNNFLSGPVPQCLFKMSEAQDGMFNRGLRVLNLRRNNLTGAIFDAFPSNCGLQTLSLNGNQLEGKLPKSLARCTSLEVLNLGNNHIEDAFPCYLKNISMLQILILRSNKFYGPVDCRGINASWPKLQIVDLAANNFTGKLPIKYFSDWKAIIDDKNEAEYLIHHLHFGLHFGGEANKNAYDRGTNNVRDNSNKQGYNRGINIVGDINYQDVITVTSKGQEAELVKILTIFSSLDFSCNNFDGPIPGEIGELTGLYIFNLSHNAFRGQIPQSLGKLTNLESLDLSSNELTGEIPIQLADGLIFLSVLNLSFNQLVGKIPQIKQFATFLETSYEGNIGLCDFPLKEKCTREESGSSPPTSEETHSNSRNAIDWNFLSAELGFVFGFGIVIGPLMIWKRWRICYYKHADDIFFKMFPQLYIKIESCQRRAHRNQGQRARRNQERRH